MPTEFSCFFFAPSSISPRLNFISFFLFIPLVLLTATPSILTVGPLSNLGCLFLQSPALYPY